MTDKALLSLPLSVRWGDMDSFNHVNNAAFATYLEEARMHWFTSLGPGWIDQRIMPILAAQTINYRIPIEWPAAIAVELRTERIGRTSLTLAFRIDDVGAGSGTVSPSALQQFLVYAIATASVLRRGPC